MLPRCLSLLSKPGEILRHVFSGPQALAFVPACVLAGFWIGGEAVMIVMAIVLPVLLAFSNNDGTENGNDPQRANTTDEAEKLLARYLDRSLGEAQGKALKLACICVEIDDYESITDRYGQATAEFVSDHSWKRLKSALRANDEVFQLGGGRFAVCIAPVRHLDLDVGLQMAERLQLVVEEPISLDATTVYVSACCGVGLSSQVAQVTGTSLARAALCALRDARHNAPSAVRLFSSDTEITETAPHVLTDEVVNALENGQIQPWFQPQISTDTGLVTGFEALARWIHPDRGLVAPSEFLPLLEGAGRMCRLGELMLFHSLSALKSWDAAGLSIPNVGVNFSPDELRNPRLVEQIEWELDRFELGPERLAVEILETVVATSPDDVVARNINGLAALGCQIDLDDFGTGHASISSIRRFAVQRLKIDRSFIMKVDQDPEQQRMVSAILLMAERLELETLAEGVETAGEHTMLAQLGCGHVQGFGISRPLPFDKTVKWVTDHIAKLDVPPQIGRKTG